MRSSARGSTAADNRNASGQQAQAQPQPRTEGRHRLLQPAERAKARSHKPNHDNTDTDPDLIRIQNPCYPWPFPSLAPPHLCRIPAPNTSHQKRKFLPCNPTDVHFLGSSWAPLRLPQVSSMSNVQRRPTGSNQRANECAKLRRDAAMAGLKATPQNLQHPNNQDENLYPNKIGNYSKGLPHNNDGTVVLSAYNALLNAINSGRPADFDAIPLGGTTRPDESSIRFGFRHARALTRTHSCNHRRRHLRVAQQAAEISENYWMALLRDVPYSQYAGKSDRERGCRGSDVVRC